MHQGTTSRFIKGRVAIGQLGDGSYGEVDEKDITPETDVIFIRPKMDFGTINRVRDAILKIDGTGVFRPGAHQIALAVHNFLAWQGPGFAGMPLTQVNIEALDEDDELRKAALAAIARRNPSKRKPATDPK